MTAAVEMPPTSPTKPAVEAAPVTAEPVDANAQAIAAKFKPSAEAADPATQGPSAKWVWRRGTVWHAYLLLASAINFLTVGIVVVGVTGLVGMATGRVIGSAHVDAAPKQTTAGVDPKISSPPPASAATSPPPAPPAPVSTAATPATSPPPPPQKLDVKPPEAAFVPPPPVVKDAAAPLPSATPPSRADMPSPAGAAASAPVEVAAKSDTAPSPPTVPDKTDNQTDTKTDNSRLSGEIPVVLRSEAESIARFDQFIAPVRDMAPSVEDAIRVRDAFASGSNVAQIKALRDQITDPLGKKLLDWQLYRNGAGSARDIRAFVESNPDWPNRDLLMQRAEQQLFTAGGSAADIKAFFKGAAPRTSIGDAALASAYLVEGNEPEAAKLASKVWRSGDIPTSLETGFIERFAKLLTEADHKWRLDRFLADDARYDSERRDRAAVIRRVVPFLSAPEQAKAQARLAVYLRTADADKLLGALPADAATAPVPDWGFALQLAQWHRRAGRIKDAATILKDAPVEADKVVSPDDWWDERRAVAYELLKAGDQATAYEIVKAPGELTVNPRKDATFLAGWIALKHLGKPDEAIKHFRDLESAADGPLSRGKAGFWLARAYEKLGQKDKAAEALASAAKNTDTFYGMMALQQIEPARSRIAVEPPRSPTEKEAARFVGRDSVRAAVLARKSGVDLGITRIFLTHLRNTLNTEPELALLAHLAEALGDTQMAVRIGKSGIARGMNLVTYAYPLHAMPLYQPLRPAPEQALLLGVARQESEFNTATVSGAGARGLLQVMPVTAQHVCKDYKLKCEIDRLGRDPAYNLTMASAYIGDRMDEFNGSYVLTLAGYNAGPGRARQWMREFGDPRDPAVDPIDWVHRIPFEETREYVLKVLSNIQMYRARLGDEANALRLAGDLRRTGNLKRAAAATGN